MAKHADGVNYAKSIDPSSGNILDPGTFSGKVRVMLDNYTFGASSLNSQNYIIVGGKLPTGSQVVEIRLSLGSPLASNASVVVGDEGDPDRYITTSYAGTGNAVLVGPTVSSTGVQYVVTGVTDNYIRVAGAIAASIISGAIMKIQVSYVVE